MTEKQYGGSKSFGLKKDISVNTKSPPPTINHKESEIEESDEYSMNIDDEKIEKLKKAGKIARETITYAKSFIKPGMPLLEIAKKIEAHIVSLGGKPAFPVNLSINEIAAHATPSYNDEELSHGLMKVDLGVHIDGMVADTAFSIDLENSEENKKLIHAAEEALNEAVSLFNLGVQISEVGKRIEQKISSFSLSPIRNLSGHSIEEYNLHAGVTIPNFDSKQKWEVEEGIYAIEPFSTNGFGSVRDGKPSTIFNLVREGNVRDNFAREVLGFIQEEYGTLPFCTRWIYDKFGTRAIIAVKRLEEAGLIHQYSQLIESGKGKVAQAEHTIIITNNDKIITTI